MPEQPWRILIVSMPPPVVERLVRFLRELGHEPVAVVSARQKRPVGDATPPEFRPGHMLEALPCELPVLYPASKAELEPLFRVYEPDLALCWGYRWKIPIEALDAPRLGSVNQHPALLPRHRGPIPLSWALREDDPSFGVTWHRMDADLDTGPILAQTAVPIEDDDTTMDRVGPRLLEAAFGLLPRVFERVAAGDKGDPQPTVGASYGPHFGEDYATVDWSQPARAIHNQVRAWRFTFGMSAMPGPIAEIDGERSRLLQTSLVEVPDAERVDAGDGPLWILDREPA